MTIWALIIPKGLEPSGPPLSSAFLNSNLNLLANGGAADDGAVLVGATGSALDGHTARADGWSVSLAAWLMLAAGLVS